MKRFASAQHAYEWMEAACDRPDNNERVHGSFSFLASGRLGITERFTIGSGLICRADQWTNGPWSFPQLRERLAR